MPAADPARRALLAAGAAAALGGGWLGWRALRPGFDGPALAPPEAHAAARAGEIVLVDIRRPDEWAATGLPAGAVALDMRRDDFRAALTEALDGDRTRPVAFICARGVRSERVSHAMQAAGFTGAIDVPEGMLGSAAGPGWLARGLPVRSP